MDAVTYPTEEVSNFITKHITPLRINVSDEAAFAKYHIFWTPCLVMLDTDGNELQRTIGFMGVEEFIPRMLLGLAKVRLYKEEYDMAMIPLKSLQETYFESKAVPEAIFFGGVTLYKQTDDPGKLKQAYEKLLHDYPDSTWTKRAYPYSLL